MQITVVIELNDGDGQQLDLDDGLTDDQIEEAVIDFAAEFALENYSFTWSRE